MKRSTSALPPRDRASRHRGSAAVEFLAHGVCRSQWRDRPGFAPGSPHRHAERPTVAVSGPRPRGARGRGIARQGLSQHAERVRLSPIHPHLRRARAFPGLRPTLAWLIALPLMALGTQAAHALDYRLVLPGAERDEILEATGHGYFSGAPQFLALCLTVLFVALTLHVAGRRGGRSGGMPAWPFAVGATACLCPPGAPRAIDAQWRRAMGGRARADLPSRIPPAVALRVARVRGRARTARSGEPAGTPAPARTRRRAGSARELSGVARERRHPSGASRHLPAAARCAGRPSPPWLDR